MDYEAFKRMCLKKSADDAGYAIAYAALLAGENSRAARTQSKLSGKLQRFKTLSRPFTLAERNRIIMWLSDRSETCLRQVWKECLQRPDYEFKNRQNGLALMALMHEIRWEATDVRTRSFGYGLQRVYAPVAGDDNLLG